MGLSKIEARILLNMASDARKNAYAPYSNFLVGAALLMKSGEIILGCNVENASYGATNCAERAAVFTAISKGEKEFLALAVVGGKAGESLINYCPPCGICRQVLAEFTDAKTFEIVLGDGENLHIFKMEQMLPFAFGSDSLLG